MQKTFKILFSLILIGGLSFAFINTIKADESGYKIINNKIYWNDELINEADPNTFVILKDNYAKDKNNVYFGMPDSINIFNNLDTNTLAIVGEFQIKDKNRAYYIQCWMFSCWLDEYPNSDPETFEYLGNYIAKDKDRVYNICDFSIKTYQYCIDENMDPETIEFISSNYLKDKKNVYYGEPGLGYNIIPNADPKTFEKINYIYSKDKNNAYFAGKIIKDADLASFDIIIKNDEVDGFYSKDKNNYYSWEKKITDTKKIQEVKELEQKILNNKTKQIEGDYYKDNFNVFLVNKKIVNAIPETFEVIKFPYSKDNLRVYYFWNAIPGYVDQDSFQILDNDYSKDKNNIYYKNHIVDDADVATFKLNYKNDYQAEDKNNYYSKGVVLRQKSQNNLNNALFNKLKGKIIIKVEQNGEAYYLNPKTNTITYLGRPEDAFKVMREQGIGISEKDFNSFNGKAPKNLAGTILLRVEANGEAYYVNPTDLKLYYLGRPADAFKVMRELGLGISNNDYSNLTEEKETNSKEIKECTDYKNENDCYANKKCKWIFQSPSSCSFDRKSGFEICTEDLHTGCVVKY